MKLYFAITYIVLGFASEAKAVTIPIAELAVREYQAKAHYQSARHKLFSSGHHRKPSGHQMPTGSAIGFAELLKEIEYARKAAAKRRKMEQIFYEMIQITNGYKN